MFDFEALERIERLEDKAYVGISAIKLKAMAMKLRHRANGYTFSSQPKVPSGSLEQPFHDDVSAVESELRQSGEKTNLDTMGSLIAICGPDNTLGLKAILIHPFCIPLVCVPLGIASYLLGWGPGWTFWLNFLALMPLAKILGDATEELAASVGNDTVSGLLNATFGNAVEVVVAVQAIRAGLLEVVKASLLGSVLSNILLVLGSAFLLGGLTPSKTKRGKFHSFHCAPDDECWRRHLIGLEKEQKFPVKSALISLAMLLFGCMSIGLPSIFNALPSNDSESVLCVSRIGAWIMMSSYIAYLIFQLLTHTVCLSDDEANLGLTPSMQACTVTHAVSNQGATSQTPQEDTDEESASLTMSCAIQLMFASTVVVATNSEFMVRTIESVVQGGGIPMGFIGVILLPLAGNACEHAAALRFAMRDRPGLAIGIAVGSATQVALLVVPFSVLAAWALGQPLNLDFGVLNTAVVTLSILVVIPLLLDGRSNWLKGYILVALYVFIAVLYWYVPQTFRSDGLNSTPTEL